MKTLITLFVLFFSSSVIASDDLSGKKIFCFKESPSNDTVYLIGFDFKSRSNVYVYTETNNAPLEVRNMSYKTSASKIVLEMVAFQWWYKISRKTLEVNNNYGTDFSGNQCSLVSENITGLFSKYLNKYKKDNLI